MRKSILSGIVFLCVYALHGQDVVRSTNRERAQQREAQKLSYRMGVGAGYNNLMTGSSQFGYQLHAVVTNEVELFERLRLGMNINAFLAGIKQSVFLNDGTRFDKERAPTGGYYWPYAAVVVYKSSRISIAPQVGYQWHIFGSEDIEAADLFQGFRARGMEYGLSGEYSFYPSSESNRKRYIRLTLSYAQLNINGQPSQFQSYSISAQYLIKLFDRRNSQR